MVGQSEMKICYWYLSRQVFHCCSLANINETKRIVEYFIDYVCKALSQGRCLREMVLSSFSW